jgi:hypothetical protein
LTEVEDFIYQFEGEQREILLFFHRIFTEELFLSDKLRYKIPFYYRKSWVCYLNPIKDEGIELAFPRANELSNDQGILDFKGRKQVAGIDVFRTSEIPLEAIMEILNEAIILDDTKQYQSKRNGRSHYS